MKKIFLFTIACFILSFTLNAANNSYLNSNETPLIFIENGVEYAVFNNGQFDFNIIKRQNSNLNTHFNTGRNHNIYVRHNNYGAIVQIENTPIFYNNYQKVSRIGSIYINYNNYGLISSIGNLNIQYNSYRTAYTCRGSINRINYSYNPSSHVYRRPMAINNFFNSKFSRQNIHRKRTSNRYYSSINIQKSKHPKEIVKKTTSKSNKSYRKNSNSYQLNSTNNKYSNNNKRK